MKEAEEKLLKSLLESCQTALLQHPTGPQVFHQLNLPNRLWWQREHSNLLSTVCKALWKRKTLQ